jgi:hypothetical protein
VYEVYEAGESVNERVSLNIRKKAVIVNFEVPLKTITKKK